MQDRSIRFWLARLLAPVAFFAAATLLVLIVRESFDEDPVGRAATFEQVDASGETVVVTTTLTEAEPAPTTTDGATTSSATTDCTPPRRATYRVKEGDTFESIAERVCSSSAALKQLNPGVDSVALQTGQTLRIRPRANE